MKREKIPLLSIVIPCFNEEEVIENSINKLLNIIFILSNKNKIDKNSYLYLIDDGSTDKTWDIITKLHNTNKSIKALKLIKNYGMQKALLAGYENSNTLGCDCVISIDADLQQDINSIETFIDKYSNDDSIDIILGIRKNRNCDNFIKKLTANLFYTLAKLLGLNIIKNHADYRLVSKKALEKLSLYKNREFFFRTFFINIGLNYSCLYFDVLPTNRKSKFKLSKMISLAIDSFISFDLKPLRLLLIFGSFTLLLGIFLNLFLIFINLLFNYPINKYNAICCILILFSGLHIFSIGILGEYIGRIVEISINNPKYIKEKDLN